MNRDRFKFRVWDEKDKEYLDPNYYEGFYMSPDGVVHVGITEWNGICDEYQEIPPEQLIIEQCTGLTDKNGKLIYEGDVVRCDLDFDPSGRVGLIREVIFKNCSFSMMTWQDRYAELSLFHNIEIIGNIHEDQFREVTKKMEE